jgi:hypothetical protein
MQVTLVDDLEHEFGGIPVWCRRRPTRIPSPSASSTPFAAKCLDHVIVLNERHLRRVLRTYLVYYNVARPHQSLRKTIARAGATYSRSRPGLSSQSPRSAGFITATSARPDRPRSPPAAAPRPSAPNSSVMRGYRHPALQPASAPESVPARTFSEPTRTLLPARTTFLTGTRTRLWRRTAPRRGSQLQRRGECHRALLRPARLP